MGEAGASSSEASDPKITSVADGILEEFFKQLGDADGFDVIAKRLKTVITTKGVSNEAAIKAAIFDEGSS